MQQVSAGVPGGAAPGPLAASSGEPAAPAGAEPQRRERKKRQTRDALVDAALALFIAKGYEQTAVREITDAVDVSERTFFRYFASKEDLALSFARDHTDALMRELTARPAHEPPLTALRNALHASIAALAAEAGDPTGDSVYRSIMKLIEGTPSLLAVHLRYMHERDEEIARVLAAREGVDPLADLRPRCVAAVFSGLFITANREWRYAGGTVEAMLATFDACADQVSAALDGHWRLPDRRARPPLAPAGYSDRVPAVWPTRTGLVTVWATRLTRFPLVAHTVTTSRPAGPPLQSCGVGRP